MNDSWGANMNQEYKIENKSLQIEDNTATFLVNNNSEIEHEDLVAQ